MSVEKMDKFREKLEELKKAELIKLTQKNLRGSLSDEPGVYVIYGGQDPKLPLYVGTTGDLALRVGQIVNTVHFDHTFTWRLFWREAERMSGRNYNHDMLYEFWDSDAEGREKVVEKIEKLLYEQLWFKCVELSGWTKDEREKLEKIVQDELKPLKPHLKKSEIPLDDLLR